LNRLQCFTLFMLIAGLLPLGAAQSEAPHLVIPRVKRAPVLADFIEGRPREAEAKVTELRQYGPTDGAPASQPSVAYISYDEKNLYVAWVCKQDPKTLRAHLMKRDTIWNEDRVSVNLDTFHDKHRSYWFDVNPYGVQMDGVTVDGQDDINFDTVWKSDAKITQDGYVVLITVPFRSIRFPGKPMQDWGIALIRLLPGNNETSCWPHITPSIQGWTNQFAIADGISDISNGHNLVLVPYAMASRSKNLDLDVPNYRQRTETRAGLDAKWVLNDALSLDMTVNPDFSQVESDDPQVTVNQRFEVYFPEKRPFFLENANLFQTPVNLFFSRRIADPSAGVRLSGKTGAWGLGSLVTDDRAEGERADPGDPSFGRRAGNGVLRVFREINGTDRVGMIYTERQIGKAANRVGGLDTRIQLNDNWSLTAQGIETETRNKDGSERSGAGYYASLNRSGRNFSSSSVYEDFAPGFESTLGFVPRVDIRRASQWMNYRWRPENSLVLSYGPSISMVRTWDHQGQTQDWWAGPGFDVELPRQTFFRIDTGMGYERYKDLDFRTHYSSLSANSDCLPWLALSASYGEGTGINYMPASGLLPFLGDKHQTTAGLTLRPGAHTIWENTYIHSDLQRRAENGGGLIFDNHILRSKLNYQFTREFSMRLILDYNTVLPNKTLIDLERTKRMGMDVLLTYLLHPGTAFYLGYTDLKENWGLDPTQRPPVWRTDSANTLAGRQFYFKLSYLFRT